MTKPKTLAVRIDRRSYERQGAELLPAVHEGATVRAMEQKGIRTEKGEFNRWIRATNAVIRDIKKKIALGMGSPDWKHPSSAGNPLKRIRTQNFEHDREEILA